MSSDSDVTLQAPPLISDDGPKKKLTRRSSLFRSQVQVTSVSLHLDKINSLPEKYVNQLVQENSKWEDTYRTIKTECLELKNKTQTASGITLSPDMSFYDKYLKKTEEFCSQTNNVTKMYENIVTYQNSQQKELLQLRISTGKRIQRNLNI